MRTLSETAMRINEHLTRFARTPAIASKKWIDGKGEERDLSLYWNPICFRAGPRAKVRYVSYQDESSLTKDEAERYLEWLNAGNVGRHYDALRAEKKG